MDKAVKCLINAAETGQVPLVPQKSGSRKCGVSEVRWALISANPVSGQSSADQRQFLHFGSRTKASHAVPGTEMLDCSHQSSWGKQLTAG
ncbi:MAG: hypothetical protein QOF56_301, partial [Acidobacteriaceae bacterium]|nr:hypothetical protein [Acidobacteriaceae bacterium]